MPTLTIRNFPEQLHETLKLRAKEFLTAEQIDEAKREGRA
jgi:plasmid stability protein